MKKENIIIDFSPIKTGGGVQLALNFIEKLKLNSTENLYFLIPESGLLAELNNNSEFNTIVSPKNYLKRFYFEYFTFQKVINKKKISKIYTFFGPGLPHPNKTKSTICIAYPIICYPESPYWKYLPALNKIKQKVINSLRVRRIKLADRILFETNIMLDRVTKQFDIDQNKCSLLPPSPSKFIKKVKKRHNKVFYFGFLSGLAGHKNLWRLPEIADNLYQIRNKKDFKFFISVDKNRYFNAINVHERYKDLFEFSGPINQMQIQQFYDNCDALVSLSDLESFSNNYMEAWKAEIPLVASKRDFAESICGESAIYVEPHDPQDVARKLNDLVNDSALRESLVTKGKEKILLLPNENERFEKILKHIYT